MPTVAHVAFAPTSFDESFSKALDIAADHRRAQCGWRPRTKVVPLVKAEIAGTRHLDRAKFQRRLGRTSFRVWTELLRCRHPQTGETRITASAVARGLRISVHTVRDCFERLIAAHLMEPRGWKRARATEHTVRRGHPSDDWDYVRKVYGADDGAPSNDASVLPHVRVPEATAAWASTGGRGGARAGTGGPRPGSGRPRSAPVTWTKGEDWLAGKSPKHPNPETSKAPQGNHQSTPMNTKTHMGSEVLLPSGEERPAGCARPGSSTFSSGSSSAASKEPTMPKPSKTEHAVAAAAREMEARRALSASTGLTSGTALGVQESRTGALVVGRAGSSSGVPVEARGWVSHPVALGTPHPAVPSRATLVQLGGSASVPQPPLVNMDDTPERRAWLLAKWFEGATQARFGKASWAFRAERKGKRGAAASIDKSKWYKLLVTASEALAEKGIAPAAWIAFSCDVWAEHNEKRTPPVDWVFSVSRMEERERWFNERAPNYTGGRVVFTPSQKEYMEADAELRRVLRLVPAHMKDEQIGQLVEKVFPRARREALVAAARAEVDAAKSDFAGRVALGEWVWA